MADPDEEDPDSEGPPSLVSSSDPEDPEDPDNEDTTDTEDSDAEAEDVIRQLVDIMSKHKGKGKGKEWKGNGPSKG